MTHDNSFNKQSPRMNFDKESDTKVFTKDEFGTRASLGDLLKAALK